MKNFRIAILLRTPQQRRRAKLANALDRFQKKEETIMFEEYDRKIPDYYPTMYMDGYSPDQILHAVRRGMIQRHRERKVEQQIKI